MIPLHFAAMSGYGGPSYVISFACGAALINMTLWVMRYLFELYRLDGAVGKAYHALPSFHVREMWYLGGLSGLLWSMGNFASIISVTFLGQGLGYSFSQLSMLISGLWYVFNYFYKKRYYNHTSAVLTLQILLRQGHLCIQRNHWTTEDIDVARKCFRRCSRNIMAELRTRLKPLIHPKLRLKADYTGISDIPSLHPSIVLGTADEKYDRTERACNRCGR